MTKNTVEIFQSDSSTFVAIDTTRIGCCAVAATEEKAFAGLKKSRKAWDAANNRKTEAQ